MNEAYLKIDSLHLTLGNFSLKNICLALKKKEYHVLLGPTGSGKSSLMRCILGFHQINNGKIYLNEKDITNDLPESRKMGYVPQNYSLFPHLNVKENIKFGLGIRKNLLEKSDSIINHLSEILNITYLLKRDIQHLSGGEKQKVALARALAIQPDMLLLDEPFSAIDEGSKRNLWIELKDIISEFNITTFHITHNLEEAYSMGEKLSVILNGEILQTGPKHDIFNAPSKVGVARYLNYQNIYSGVVEKSHKHSVINAGHFSVFIPKQIPVNTQIKFCIRQQDIKLIKKKSEVKDVLKNNIFKGTIISIFPLLDYCLIKFKINGSPQNFDFEIKFPRSFRARYGLKQGGRIRIALVEANIIIFSE